MRLQQWIALALAIVMIPRIADAETWHFKQDFLQRLVARVPAILESQNKETGRFGTGIWMVNDQHPMYPLAVAWATKIDGVENPYYRNDQVLEAIMSAGDALIADQDAKGMWEFRKKDGSTWGQIYMPWTYSRWIRAFALVRDGMPADCRDKWEKALILGFDGIAKTETKKPMQNIPVHNCMGLYLASKIFNRPDWEKAAVDYLHACVKEQHPDGYWTEHSGPVVMYNGVYVDALGQYYGMSRDKTVLEALARSSRFHAAMTYPDGRAVETVDERNPYHENIAGINLGFAFTPEGRGYVKRQIETLAKHTDNPVGPEIAASFILYGEEAEFAPPPRSGDVYVSGDGKAMTRRQGPWFICMTSYTAEVPQNRWIQDRQNFVSLFHDDASLILGGGNTKLQPLWSTFTVGDVSLLQHKAGDEDPKFIPPAGLMHTPSSASLDAENNRVDLNYGGLKCAVAVDISQPQQARLTYSLQSPPQSEVAAHVTLIPHLKGEWSTASGKKGILSDESFTLSAGEAGEWCQHRNARVTLPANSTITWPALPHNPYRKDGRAEASEGRIVITLPFSPQQLTQEIVVTLDGEHE